MNLKWNIDGKGFKTPSPEYIEFVKRKRDELYRLGITTFVSVVLGTISLAFIRGHATLQVICWIFVYNVIGMVLGYAASVAAK